MTSYRRDGTVGPWASEKLNCLEKYLSAYTTILRKQSWCHSYLYIDAFAGAGRAKLRQPDSEIQTNQVNLFANLPDEDLPDEESESYIDGSPRVALSIKHPFTKYIFIELNPDRASQLEELKSEFRNSRDIQIVAGEANNVIQKKVLERDLYDWSRTRAVAFLDPFGLQVPWKTIEALASTKAIEVIVNLPVGMTIQRMLPASGEFTSQQRDRLTSYFGSPDWESILYSVSSGLLGDTREKIRNSGEVLARWYQERMTEAFGHAAVPRLIRNSSGGHLYYLLWAGPNPTGARIASHVLAQGTPIHTSTGS